MSAAVEVSSPGASSTRAAASVSRVEARTVVVPLRRPTRIARRDLVARSYTLVRVREPGGLTGIGFCLSGAPATGMVRDLIAPKVVGASPFETERVWDETYHDIILNGRRGAALRAMSAVDIALWDLQGKLTGLPCAQLMGLYRDRVPAYASGGYYFSGDPIRHIEDEVAGWMAAGFQAIKIKVGGAPLDVDVARVGAARRMAGNGVELMLDANNAWRDTYSALRAIRRFEEFGIAWIEEPLSPDNHAGHRQLKERCSIPVATGEIEATRWGFAELIRTDAADVLQPDAAVVGGFTEWQRIAHTASSFDLPVAPHWFSDLHVHCVASAPNGLWIEHFTDSQILNVMQLFERSLQVRDGWAAVPSEPGLGLILDETAIDRHAVDAWG